MEEPNVNFLISNWRLIKAQSQKEKFYCAMCGLVTFLLLVIIIAGFGLMSPRAEEKICDSHGCIKSAHHILSYINKTGEPCQDFYQFSCGGFHSYALNPTKNRPYNSPELVLNLTLPLLLTERVKDEQKLTKSLRDGRKYYRACLNDSAIAKESDKTFLQILKNVTGGWPMLDAKSFDSNDWMDIMVKARRAGVMSDLFFATSIYDDHKYKISYLILKPPSLFYFNLEMWTEENIPLFFRMAQIFGNPISNGEARIKSTILFVQKFHDLILQANRDLGRFPLGRQVRIADLDEMYQFNGSIDWLTFLRNLTRIDLDGDVEVLFGFQNKKYFDNLELLLQNTGSEVWTNYIVFSLILDNFGLLSLKMQRTCMELLRSPWKSKSREEYCYGEANLMFHNVLEAEYIRRTISEEKRHKIQEMVTDLKDVMKENLLQKKSLEKPMLDLILDHLKRIKVEIGWLEVVYNSTEYERIFGFNKEELPDNLILMHQHLTRALLDNVYKAIKTSGHLNLEKYYLKIPVDADVSATYYENYNMILLPTSILQDPIYDSDRPEYMNYGSMGNLIARELIESLNYFATNANLSSTESSMEHRKFSFTRINDLKCVNERYKNYLMMHHRNKIDKFRQSNVTQSIIFLDFAANNLAYLAYQRWTKRHGSELKLSGLKYNTEQLFWISSSTYLCEHPDFDFGSRFPDYPVSSYRVNGPKMNSPFFAKSFDCPKNGTMNPAKKCVIMV